MYKLILGLFGPTLFNENYLIEKINSKTQFSK